MKIIKPRRATRTDTQHLMGSPDRVLPLLCPVREADSSRPRSHDRRLVMRRINTEMGKSTPSTSMHLPLTPCSPVLAISCGSVTENRLRFEWPLRKRLVLCEVTRERCSERVRRAQLYRVRITVQPYWLREE